MLKKFWGNTRKPQGILGRMMLGGMNTGHAKMAEWGLSKLKMKDGIHALDIGCGGGANIVKMLKDMPNSLVDGVDYSDESVAVSKKTNAKHLGKRCTIQQGNVLQLPYSDQSLELVTAFETIYFWPTIDSAFEEVGRVLKPGGTFLICCDTDDADDTTWTKHIEGMIIYRVDDLKQRLLKVGFQQVDAKRHEKGWVCVAAKK